MPDPVPLFIVLVAHGAPNPQGTANFLMAMWPNSLPASRFGVLTPGAGQVDASSPKGMWWFMPQGPRRRPGTPRRPPASYRKIKAVPARPPAAAKSAWDKAPVIIQIIGALAIIVPLIALYESVHQFNVQQTTNTEQMLDQQRQATLSGYLDDMSVLVLQYNLPKSKPHDPVRAIAVARTLTAVRDLDGSRKGTLIRYLWEAGLVMTPHPIVDLNLANLNGSIFNDADLDGAALTKLGLNNAQLRGTQLIHANLSGSALFGSDFAGADLSRADLSGSAPIAADLAGANLAGADLAGADLTGANLTGATLTGAHFKKARCNSRRVYVKNVEGQRVIEGPTQFPRGFNSRAAGMICYY